VQSGRLDDPSHQEQDDQSSGLDVHASSALDRLTRWAAKALRGSVAIITLVRDEQPFVASRTGAGTASISARLADFTEQILATGQPHAIGDWRSEDAQHEASSEGVAFLGAPLLDHEGRVVGSLCIADTRARVWTVQDIELVTELTTSAITELELQAARNETAREKRWSDSQQAVLELIAARTPLARTLTKLLHAAEAHAPGMLASILLVERRRGESPVLRLAAAHSLPAPFAKLCSTVAIGEGQSVCGTAAHRGEPVIVRDLAEDPLGRGWAHLAADQGIRACWSTPIRSSSGAILGTFALYFTSPRLPDDHEQLVVDRSIHLARLAIEQADDARALRRNATRAQSLAREQTALQRVATSVAGESDPAILFGLVAEQVGRLLKAEAGYVLRFEDGDRLQNMGCWARDETRVLPVGAVIEQVPDGVCTQLRKVRRRSVGADGDLFAFQHRIAAAILVNGATWGSVVALRDGGGAFPSDDEKRILRFAQLASVAVANADAHAQLAAQARTDPLTGLANRRAFDERLADETERAQRHERELSVILVDVDQFKTINDRFGHATGDRVLVNLAGSVRGVMRSGDLLARIGGDEMAIVLPDCGAEKAELVARRMLEAIAEDSSLARRHGVTLSAGVAGLTPGQSADDLLRGADQALYRAKDEGRNQVVSYDADLPLRGGLRLSA